MSVDGTKRTRHADEMPLGIMSKAISLAAIFAVIWSVQALAGRLEAFWGQCDGTRKP